MKTIQYTVIICSLFFNSVIFAQIPNDDFELWEPDSIYEKPIGWTTNNGEFTSGLVEKNTDADSGSYSIRLESGSSYTMTAKTGFHLDYHPHNLNFYVMTYRYTNDITEVKIILFKNGFPVDSGDVNITTVNYIDFFLVSLAISNNNLESDSAIIQLSASSPSLSQDACFFWVDHMWFDDNVGIASINNDKDFWLFPNPASDVINILQSMPVQKPVKAIIRDIAGKIYWKNDLKTKSTEINVTGFPAGVYFIALQNEEKNEVLKFIKR